MEGFRVRGMAFRAWGLGCLGSRTPSVGCRVQGFTVCSLMRRPDFRFRMWVWGIRSRASGSGNDCGFNKGLG